ncbi:MAG: phospholipase A [Spirochaetes bacterium]|nr:phospholipase A [Spirochaetota bacterium]
MISKIIKTHKTHRIFYFLLAIIMVFRSSLRAEKELEQPTGDSAADLELPSVEEIIDYNKSNNVENGFSTHKQNYVLPITLGNHTNDRKNKEIKFQISVKQRLLRFYGWAFYFAYSQKSFWQAYDIDNSSPFRENNFNPELFIRTKMWYGIRTDLGLEHESNGQELPESRSWNRIYFTPYYENDFLIASLKLWYRFPEKEKKDSTDEDRDDNPDIIRYYGYGELNLTAKFPSLFNTWLSGTFRYHQRWKKGSFEVNLTVPMATNSMKWIFHYWEGYGESLIDYNVYQRKIGLGICLTQ